MANILTPNAMWNNFDDSLPTCPRTLSITEDDGIRLERVLFSGRETGAGRVQIYALLAQNAKNPEAATVLIFPDSNRTADEEVVKLFVRRGYSALMVDYRGVWEGCETVTRYPENVSYANTRTCGRAKDFVDESADKTCWYEWVALGIYARKFLAERVGAENIAAVGLRDGGEVVWKLGYAVPFSCIVPVCAAGWKAYSEYDKYLSEEPSLSDERYRFIAGIDSQSYATGVKSPVLMLCSTNDQKFDYDRAYDTFSRINPDFLGSSVFSYSVQCNACIDAAGTADMFLFLDKFLKRRHVFLPKNAEVTVAMDGEDNLVARVSYDDEGIAEKFSVYLAEDCADSALREWESCAESETKGEFLLDIHEKTTTVFVVASVRYSNGFTAWSKIGVRKISGRFRNMRPRCAVIYTDKQGTDGFTVSDYGEAAVGGLLLCDDGALPRVVVKAGGICGLYSAGGLTTNRMSNPRFSPAADSVLKLDVFCDGDDTLTLTVMDLENGESYVYTAEIVGGVWQSVIAESKNFKQAGGVPLPDFKGQYKLNIACGGGYAVNNIMWL